ncbi:MAG: phosphatase PAP2 family protein [Nocardioidaceae bacterium]
MTWLHHLNDRAFLDVNSFARHTGWLNTLGADYATYGVVLFAAMLVAGVVVSRRRGPATLAAAGWAALATLIAVAVNQPIGRAVAEARPYTAYPHALVLVARTSDFAFPSDHSVMAGAVAAGLFLVSRRLGWIATVLAVLLAFARVYVGAHYPGDVIAGLALGAAISWLGWLLVRRPLTVVARWLRGLPGLRQVLVAEPARPSTNARQDPSSHLS